MNRAQIFSLLVGIIIFAFVGFCLEVQRYDIYGDQWPILADVIVILVLIAIIAAGAVVMAKELTSLRKFSVIISFSVVGLIIGGAVWLTLSKVAPQCTAQVAIEVLPPGQIDPFSFAPRQIDKDLYYQFRTDKAAFITQQSTLENLLRRDKVRATDWFRQFDNDIEDAIEELEDNLRVKVRRNSNLIELSMTCPDKKESVLIVNEMLDLFLKGQQDRATRDVRKNLITVTEQQRRFKTELRQVEDVLVTFRSGTEFINLDRVDLPDHMSQKITDLETKCNNLEAKMSIVQSHIDTLNTQPQSKYKELVREQIAHDPAMSILIEKLTLLELEFAEKSTVSGEDEPEDGQIHKMIDIINRKMEERSAKIVQDIHRSNLHTAKTEMAALSEQLETVQRQKDEARQQIKDFDNLRANYAQYISIRDEKQALLGEVSDHIEKLYAVLEHPEISRVKMVGLAPQPLKISSPLLRPYLLGGALLGLIAGMGFVLLRQNLKDTAA